MSQSRSSTESLDGEVGEAYHEEAFQHFLAVERVRAERADRPFLLLMISLRRSGGGSTEIPRAVSAVLLSVLSTCVREVDFVGWYRDQQVAGAVLTQGIDLPDREAPRRILARVTRVLNEHLPESLVDRLRVRVVRLGLNPNRLGLNPNA